MKILLNHQCNIREAKGLPGQVIDAPNDVAKKLIARGGATLVDKKTSPKGAPPMPPIHKRAIDLANELGIDILDVTGSGAQGAITVEDVKLHAELATKPDGDK